MKIKEAVIKFSSILEAKGFESARLDVELLLCFVLGCNRVDLINNDDYELGLDQHNKFLELFLRREKHEPIAYLTNEKEFCSYKFFVNKDVLIPRPITEELVVMILDDILKNEKNDLSNIIDVGTGSGVIIISLLNRIFDNIEDKNLIKNYNFYATDISKKALLVANINAKKYNLLDKIKFLKGNLKFPRKIKFDYIVANLPYLNIDDINFKNDSSKDLKYEPKNALFSKSKGFYLVKKLLRKAKKHINRRGIIYLEIEKGQMNEIKKFFHNIYDVEGFYEDRIVKIKMKKD